MTDQRTKNIDERVTCPFDRSHVIERRRLQTHIIKCRRNLPANHDFVVCRFWELHYVKKDQIDAHYLTCEHALMKQAEKRTSNNSTVYKFKQPELIVDESVRNYVSTESWEDIPNAPQNTFKAEVLMAQAPHAVMPQGLSKAKRKVFKEEERKRIRNMESALSRPVKTEPESEEDEGPKDGWSSPEEGEIKPRKSSRVPNSTIIPHTHPSTSTENSYVPPRKPHTPSLPLNNSRPPFNGTPAPFRHAGPSGDPMPPMSNGFRGPYGPNFRPGYGPRQPDWSARHQFQPPPGFPRGPAMYGGPYGPPPPGFGPIPGFGPRQPEWSNRQPPSSQGEQQFNGPTPPGYPPLSSNSPHQNSPPPLVPISDGGSQDIPRPNKGRGSALFM